MQRGRCTSRRDTEKVVKEEGKTVVEQRVRVSVNEISHKSCLTVLAVEPFCPSGF